MESQNETITISRAEFERVQNLSEKRRLAMCDVRDLVSFVFGDGGIPKSKSVFIGRITKALMHGDELEAYASKFDENAIQNFTKLCEK